MEWIKQQISKGSLPADGLEGRELSFSLGETRVKPDEADPERIKNIVNPKDYEEAKLLDGKSFYLGRNLSQEERVGYMTVLQEFSEIYSWTPSDLTGIPPNLGEHHIDLIDESIRVRQRQY